MGPMPIGVRATLALLACALAVVATGCRWRRAPATSSSEVPAAAAPSPREDGRAPILRVAGRPVWAIAGAIVFAGDLAIDADGAATAYHPTDDRLALDYRRNGYPWAIVQVDGVPWLQRAGDPAPGFYVSTTALADRRRAVTDPRRYVDAVAVPYVVVPPALIASCGVRLGDVAMVVDLATGRRSCAVVADVGPADALGEGSIALARALALAKDAKHGGPEARLGYALFTGTARGWPRAPEDIERAAATAFAAWGGVPRLRRAVAAPSP
jgi:hypothetical protein